jgi:tRNA-modifying protein YgfZ
MSPAPPLLEQHRQAHDLGGFCRSTGRGLLEVYGPDRADWLHNLVTNVVRTLQPGEGNYAFAVNRQGRTLFDLNMLALDDRLWLDIDRRWTAPALAHLHKHLVVEKVELADVSDRWARFTVFGPAAWRLLGNLDLPGSFPALADRHHLAGCFDRHPLLAVKNNIGPVPRADLYVPRPAADDFDRQLAEQAASLSLPRLDEALLDVIHLETGIPRSVDDIDDQVIPPETNRIADGISYVKGCYLGQEVIERMRSHGARTRSFVGLRIPGDVLPPRNSPIIVGDKPMGRATSACLSPALGGVLAVGYLKTMFLLPGQPLRVAISDAAPLPADLVDLPLPFWQSPER